MAARPLPRKPKPSPSPKMIAARCGLRGSKARGPVGSGMSGQCHQHRLGFVGMDQETEGNCHRQHAGNRES